MVVGKSVRFGTGHLRNFIGIVHESMYGYEHLLTSGLMILNARDAVVGSSFFWLAGCMQTGVLCVGIGLRGAWHDGGLQGGLQAWQDGVYIWGHTWTQDLSVCRLSFF